GIEPVALVEFLASARVISGFGCRTAFAKQHLGRGCIAAIARRGRREQQARNEQREGEPKPHTPTIRAHKRLSKGFPRGGSPDGRLPVSAELAPPLPEGLGRWLAT